MSLSRKTLEHPVLVLIVFALLGIIGISSFNNIAISLFPDIDSPYVMVLTTYSNAGPESVEKSVTKVLESSLVSVNGLKELSSSSSEGSSMVFLEFNYGTDLESAVNDVRDKLDRVKRSLPDGASTPSIFKMDASAMPIMRIAMRGNRSTDDLRQIAEDDVIDILEQTDGVAEASVSGGRAKIVRVEISENRLAAYGLNISTVSSALAKQNFELGGGKITEGKMNYVVRTTGEYSTVDEIDDTVITTVNGYDVKLRDIGNAFMGYEDASSTVYINGEPGVYVSITKQSGTNSVTVANATYKKIEQVQATLPSDITLEIISDDTTAIRDTISTLVTSAWQGLLLAVIILFVFLQNFKSTLIISISIPLSLVITIMCMSFAGITINIMTLTGLILGVGMIVDASIVIIENIYAYRSRGAKPKISAVLGSQEMLMSVISGNLTTICVFVPFLFFLKDLEMMGQMFKGIIFTVVIALVSSLFVAIFLVPVLAGKFLPLSNRTEKPVQNRVLKAMYASFQNIINALTKVYRRGLKCALDHRAVTIVVSVSVLFMAIALFPTLKINMMGRGGGDDSVTLNVTMPTGTSLAETTKVVQAFETIAKNEIQGYTTLIMSVGTGGRRSSASTYTGSLSIRLPETSKQIDTSETIQKKLRAHFDEFADAQLSFGAGWRGQISGSDIVIKIRSDDLETALSVSDKIKDVMEKIDAIGEVTIDTKKGLPQVEVVIDRQRAYAFGVDVTTVAREINYAMNGVTSTVFRSNGKEYDVVVMYRPEDRDKVSDLESIYVRGTNGMVSVANFASLKKGLGPVSINRENQSRVIEVSADIISDENANVVENEIKSRIADTFVIPENVTVSYEGSWSDVQKQGRVYGLIALMAFLLVFGVMAATYESFKAPLINMMTIPFLIIGVVFIYKFTGQTMSMTSMVGIIMLVGIVVNNGIILVDYTNLLIDRGMKMKEACLEAGASRLRPVLMTTLTTILGTLPMCFQFEGTAQMVQPIGLSIVGGLTSSTFVTLFIIPVLYSLVMKEKKSVDTGVAQALADFVIGEGGDIETGAVQTSAGTVQSGDVPVEQDYVQAGIVANQSVEDDIIETLEQAVPDIRYTIIPTVNGRGGDNYKLGTATWPEQNFMMIAYMKRKNVATVSAAVRMLKKKFPKEGIKLFLV
ncbi:PG0541 family transporter-associated protein [Treponema socranskii]|uniref:PG0541 family transporter-associated protein n=1 Tax=Treponema socranskii TaxID=53419 RepID=UPI0023EFDC0C|nr:PG0541 family transporter-associated protein [Treponema socranskii]